MLMLKTRKKGLTLIEVLVSVTIVAILAAGLFVVGNYIDTQIKVERTKATINLLVTALDQYFDFYHKFPVPIDANELSYNRLSAAPDAKKIIDQINRKAMEKEGSGMSADVRFIDAWGKRFRYEYKDEWNFPVIISAGHDKDFDDPNDKDNISSKGL